MAVTVQDSITSLRKEFFAKCASVEAELSKAAGSGSLSINSLAADFTAYKSQFLDTINILQKQVDILIRNVDNLEMSGRRKILLIHGIEEDDSDSEDVSQSIVKVAQSQLMMSGFTSSDIKRCHRMGRRSTGSRPRPILCKFQCVTVRDKAWSSKTKLKGSGVTISEFLTTTRHSAFIAGRLKFGITKCFSQGGHVFVISPSGTRHRVVTVEDVNNISTEAPKPPEVPDKTISAPRTRRNATKK